MAMCVGIVTQKLNIRTGESDKNIKKRMEILAKQYIQLSYKAKNVKL